MFRSIFSMATRLSHVWPICTSQICFPSSEAAEGALRRTGCTRNDCQDISDFVEDWHYMKIAKAKFRKVAYQEFWLTVIRQLLCHSATVCCLSFCFLCPDFFFASCCARIFTIYFVRILEGSCPPWTVRLCIETWWCNRTANRWLKD